MFMKSMDYSNDNYIDDYNYCLEHMEDEIIIEFVADYISNPVMGELVCLRNRSYYNGYETDCNFKYCMSSNRIIEPSLFEAHVKFSHMSRNGHMVFEIVSEPYRVINYVSNHHYLVDEAIDMIENKEVYV